MPGGTKQIIKVKSRGDAIQELIQIIETSSRNAIEENKVFNIGVSGGSVIDLLLKVFLNIRANFTKWKVFFCDERFVDEDNEQSIYGNYKKRSLLIENNQFIRIDLNTTLSNSAKNYEDKIRKEFNVENNVIPSFDLLILGMGPDGHTCSLFPEHPLLKENEKLIGYIENSPKPPSERVTFTLPLINNSKHCVFVVSGADKAEAIKKIHIDNEPLPAGMVQPISGNVTWIIDSKAGSHLKE